MKYVECMYQAHKTLRVFNPRSPPVMESFNPDDVIVSVCLYNSKIHYMVGRETS